MRENSQEPRAFWKKVDGLTLAVGIVLLSTGAGPSGTGAVPQGQPRLQLEEREHDFGKMKRGEIRSHVFRFINSGAGELQIHGVAASCGCTAILLSDRRIPPGGTGQIQVTFRALSVGESIEKGVTLRSNDPQEPVTKLKILASVPPKVAVQPGFLRWDRLKTGEPIPSKTILLSGEGLEISRVETSAPALQARLRDLGEREGRRQFELQAGLDPARLPSGQINQRVSLYTNQDGQEVVVIPVLGFLEGEVTVAPPLLSFGLVRKGQAPTRSFEVSKARSPELEILKVESSLESLSTRIVPLEPGRRYRIEVGLKSEAKAGRIQGSVVLHTTDRLQPTLQVPVYGLVQGE